MYKAVVVDLDGVLKPYTEQKSPEPFDLEAIVGIKLLEKNGVKLCYISGKKTSYINNCITCSGLNEDNFIIGENGGVVYSNGNSPIKYTNFIGDIETLRKTLLINTRKWTHFKNRDLKGHIMEEEKDTGLSILLSGLDPSEFAKYLNTLIETMKLKLSVVYGPSYIDIMQKGVDKAYALNIFSEKTGIKPDNIIGVGDGKNDIPMLKNVGLPAAPVNAISEVKGIIRDRGGYISEKPIGKGFLDISKFIINFKD